MVTCVTYMREPPNGMRTLPKRGLHQDNNGTCMTILCTGVGIDRAPERQV